MEVRPTILSDDLDIVKAQMMILNNLNVQGHLDVIDGKFETMKTIRPSEIILSEEWECHLMVEEPIDWVDECVNSNIGRVIGQIEKMSSQQEFVEKVQRLQMEAGLAIDLDTDVKALDSETLVWVDRVLVMGVKAGESGQIFQESVLAKIDELVAWRKVRGYTFMIEVDGGVSVEVAKQLKERGVEVVAMHSAFWVGDVSSNWERLKEI